jgi:hypothetical protein
MKTKAFILGLGLAVSATASYAAVLGTYDFTLSNTDAPVNPNMTFGSGARTGVSAVPSVGTFLSSGFDSSAGLHLGQYIQFVFTPNPGFILNVTGIGWTSSRDADGPERVSLRLFQGDNPPASSTSLAAINYLPGTTPGSVLWNLPGAGVSSEESESLTLRIYGFNADSGAGTFTLDDLTLYGEFSGSGIPPVPEPGTVVLLGAGVLGIWGGNFLRRRRSA